MRCEEINLSLHSFSELRVGYVNVEPRRRARRVITINDLFVRQIFPPRFFEQLLARDRYGI